MRQLGKLRLWVLMQVLVLELELVLVLEWMSMWMLMRRQRHRPGGRPRILGVRGRIPRAVVGGVHGVVVGVRV